MSGRREGRGELAYPSEVGRVERPGPPDVHATGPDGRQQAPTGDQAHPGRRSRAPDLRAQSHPITGTIAEQHRQGVIERDKIRRDQALAYAVRAAGEDQLDLAGPGAAAPVREHAPPGNLTRHEDQFAV